MIKSYPDPTRIAYLIAGREQYLPHSSLCCESDGLGVVHLKIQF